MHIVYVFLFWSLTVLDRDNNPNMVVKQTEIKSTDLYYESSRSFDNFPSEEVAKIRFQ